MDAPGFHSSEGCPVIKDRNHRGKSEKPHCNPTQCGRDPSWREGGEQLQDILRRCSELKLHNL